MKSATQFLQNFEFDQRPHREPDICYWKWCNSFAKAKALPQARRRIPIVNESIEVTINCQAEAGLLIAGLLNKCVAYLYLMHYGFCSERVYRIRNEWGAPLGWSISKSVPTPKWPVPSDDNIWAFRPLHACGLLPLWYWFSNWSWAWRLGWDQLEAGFLISCLFWAWLLKTKCPMQVLSQINAR